MRAEISWGLTSRLGEGATTLPCCRCLGDFSAQKGGALNAQRSPDVFLNPSLPPFPHLETGHCPATNPPCLAQ